MANEVELTAAVEQQLRDAKMPFQKGVVVGDASPDFVVTTPEGEHVVLEVKAWEPNTANTARALHQVERFKELSKAAAALIVTATGETTIQLATGGVVAVAQLAATLTKGVELFPPNCPGVLGTRH